MSKKIKLFIIIVALVILGIGIYRLKRSFNANYQVKTEVKETSSYVQSITSVVTSNDKLNRILAGFIKKQEQFFYTQIQSTQHVFLIDRDELNIDYKFQLLNNKTWSISLITSMTGPSFSYPYYRVDCWTWDNAKQKELNLSSLFPSSFEFSLFQNQVFEEIKKECSTCISEQEFSKIFTQDFKTFQITENGITFYFNPFLFDEDYYDIIPVSMDISIFSLRKKKNSKNVELNPSSPPSSKIIDPKKPAIALTFDDGPSQYTEEIIKILEENEVNATFFILGNKVEAYEEILKRSIRNGNELGNHSYNHKWLSQLSTRQLTEQIEKTQEIMQKRLGYTPRYLRPTYGSVTNRIRKNTELGIALWTVDTKDWKIHNIDRIVERATYNIEDGDIILMHDIFERSKSALRKIIPILKEQGFQFLTISELEEVKKIRKLENIRVNFESNFG